MTQPTFTRFPIRPQKPTPDTNLIVGIILPLYRMMEEDIAALADKLAAQMTTEYLKTIQTQLQLYGCNRPASGPDAISQRWITGKSKTDAAGIARTYNRELENKIRMLYEANPRGNRSYYYKNLDAWAAARNQWKLPSIALNTAQAIRQYAQQRFRDENGISGRYIFTGPAPVCSVCISRKALGVVTLEMTKKYPFPAHPGCVHSWSEITPKKIPCDETTWTG